MVRDRPFSSIFYSAFHSRSSFLRVLYGICFGDRFRRACKVAGSGGEILLDHHHKPAFITSTAGHRPSSWLSTQSCRDQPRSNCLQFVAGHRSSDSNNLFVHLSSLILATWPAQFYAVFLPQVLCNVVSQTQSNH